MMDQSSLRYRGIYTKIPGDPSRWRKWHAMGEFLVEEARRRNGGQLPDQLMYSGAESEFPRLFQMLAEGGTIGFSDSTRGKHMTFLGKGAALRPERMLQRADFTRGEFALFYYGCSNREKVDRNGLEILEALHRSGGRIIAVTNTEEQRLYLEDRYAEMLIGVISLEQIALEEGNRFDWPSAMPWLPESDRYWQECQDTIGLYKERTIEPFARRVTNLLPEGEGGFDLIFERAGQDTLGVSTALVRPKTGRVVYAEAMEGRRYSFYSPHVWEGERKVFMPLAVIDGSPSFAGQRENDPLSESTSYHVRQTG
ncbi:acrylyl-CoA reductase (NADPH) / 3-hydroxypropionyl-CoA dehydratase / 3-hydroxypropionyl-CoA synthetase [Marininema mesophilum]|uniref:Acrylyl-CoA reductase (NADPH) / 3-hydroxypropionyl-CoA dehydratase / 3-hydroxypropionyl-CoA synthetase n=1 Tax=Marininema mesophilum TaxID=1048340 RepID=A0A1H2SFC2_9BACL|nr:hypothetical protein [Marininema mesophilum]SDW29679.1 acrylyl-CoA reductase (NADPH) / 3-hydroxypropionyl-CoA dehydratase / 3-hydroxypropionyl-CoA synthetase [Marininema mesophilum]